jgi:ribonuclease P protein component
MLKKKYILSKKNDFKKVLGQKKFFRNKYCIVKRKENELKYSRLGVIISSKVSKKAVVRNKIKRKIKNCFKTFLAKNQNKNFDFVIIVFFGFNEDGITELQKQIENFF